MLWLQKECHALDGSRKNQQHGQGLPVKTQRLAVDFNHSYFPFYGSVARFKAHRQSLRPLWSGLPKCPAVHFQQRSLREIRFAIRELCSVFRIARVVGLVWGQSSCNMLSRSNIGERSAKGGYHKSIHPTAPSFRRQRANSGSTWVEAAASQVLTFSFSNVSGPTKQDRT